MLNRININKYYAGLVLITVSAVLFLSCFLAKTAHAGPSLDFQGTVLKADNRNGRYEIHINDGYLLKIRLNVPVKSLRRSILPGDRVYAGWTAGRKTGKFRQVKGECFNGRVLAVKRNKILIAPGRQVYFIPGASFSLNGKLCSFKDIKPGDSAYLRVDPQTGRAGSIQCINVKRYKKTPLGDVRLENLRVTRRKNFRKGEMINVIVHGAPKMQVSFDITGICAGVPLYEKKPGKYTGSYTFVRGNARNARVILRMAKNGKSVVRLSANSFDVAVDPPQITPLSPGPGDTVSGSGIAIFAQLQSKGSVVNPSSITVYLDGRPLSRGLVKNVDFAIAGIVRKLSPGVHRVRVVVEDYAGNRGYKGWSFRVR